MSWVLFYPFRRTRIYLAEQHVFVCIGISVFLITHSVCSSREGHVFSRVCLLTAPPSFLPAERIRWEGVPLPWRTTQEGLDRRDRSGKRPTCPVNVRLGNPPPPFFPPNPRIGTGAVVDMPRNDSGSWTHLFLFLLLLLFLFVFTNVNRRLSSFFR